LATFLATFFFLVFGKKVFGYFFGYFSEKVGYFFSQSSGHTAVTEERK
jgi:hypothetical protein